MRFALLAIVFMTGCAAAPSEVSGLAARDDVAAERTAFKCSGFEPHWAVEITPTMALWVRPRDEGIVEEPVAGGWTLKDEMAGEYLWKSADGRRLRVSRMACRSTSDEILDYRLTLGAPGPEACCRRLAR